MTLIKIVESFNTKLLQKRNFYERKVMTAFNICLNVHRNETTTTTPNGISSVSTTSMNPLHKHRKF